MLIAHALETYYGIWLAGYDVIDYSAIAGSRIASSEESDGTCSSEVIPKM
jgi:hypothetical protein